MKTSPVALAVLGLVAAVAIDAMLRRRPAAQSVAATADRWQANLDAMRTHGPAMLLNPLDVSPETNPQFFPTY